MGRRGYFSKQSNGIQSAMKGTYGVTPAHGWGRYGSHLDRAGGRGEFMWLSSFLHSLFFSHFDRYGTLALVDGTPAFTMCLPSAFKPRKHPRRHEQKYVSHVVPNPGD